MKYGGDDSITLDVDTMKSIFDPVVDEIIRTSNRQLRLAAAEGSGPPSGAHKVRWH